MIHMASLQTWSQLDLHHNLSVGILDPQAGPVSAFPQKVDLRAASLCITAKQAIISMLGEPLHVQTPLCHLR